MTSLYHLLQSQHHALPEIAPLPPSHHSLDGFLQSYPSPSQSLHQAQTSSILIISPLEQVFLFLNPPPSLALCLFQVGLSCFGMKPLPFPVALTSPELWKSFVKSLGKEPQIEAATSLNPLQSGPLPCHPGGLQKCTEIPRC